MAKEKKTTLVEIDNAIHKELKIYSVVSGENLTSIATRAIKELLKKEKKK